LHERGVAGAEIVDRQLKSLQTHPGEHLQVNARGDRESARRSSFEA
jgi:hypothetical protein